MITLGTIKVLLVPVAFENRVLCVFGATFIVMSLSRVFVTRGRGRLVDILLVPLRHGRAVFCYKFSRL